MTTPPANGVPWGRVVVGAIVLELGWLLGGRALAVAAGADPSALDGGWLGLHRALAVLTPLAVALDRARLGVQGARQLAVGVLYLVIAVMVLGRMAALVPLDLEHDGHGLYLQLAGEAERPFAFRLGVPWLVEGLIACLPAELAARLDTLAGATDHAMTRLPPEPRPVGMALRLVLVHLVGVASLVAAQLGGRRLVRAVLAAPTAVADLAPALALLALPLTGLVGRHPYDAPELALITWTLALGVQARWRSFWPVFVAALLTKETSLLLVVHLAAWHKGGAHEGFARQHLRAAVVVGVVWNLAVRGWFADRPGEGLVWHLGDNLRYASRVSHWTGWIWAYDGVVPFPRASNLAALGVGGALGVVGWREASARLRRLVAWPSAVLLPAYVVWGYHDELRALALLWPGLALLVLAGLLAAWRDGDEPVSG